MCISRISRDQFATNPPSTDPSIDISQRDTKLNSTHLQLFANDYCASIRLDNRTNVMYLLPIFLSFLFELYKQVRIGTSGRLHKARGFVM